MAMNVQLSDEANYVLDEYIIEANKLKEKGKTASEAVVANLLPQLSELRQRIVLNRFPHLAAAIKNKSVHPRTKIPA